MIISVGVDIINNTKVKKAVEKYGLRFMSRVFTKKEINYINTRKIPFIHAAVRFAAKEACIKALSVKGDAVYSMREIEIKRNENGFVEYNLSGKAEKVYKKLKVKNVHLSLSHERNYSVAFCVFEG
ncbi:holo-ACP synthase [Spirochaetota bacterium]